MFVIHCERFLPVHIRRVPYGDLDFNQGEEFVLLSLEGASAKYVQRLRKDSRSLANVKQFGRQVLVRLGSCCGTKSP